MLRLARRAAPLALAVALLSLPAEALAAAPTGRVSETNFEFTPDSGTGPLGTRIIWTNDSPFTPHTTTSDTTNPDGSPGIGLWNSGSQGPGDEFSFILRAAGTFPYHCTFHEDLGMVASVSIRPKAQPASGEVGDTFTIRVATLNPPPAFVFDIQKKDPGGTFQDWMTDVTTMSVEFVPDAPGTYEFRSRVRRVSTNGASLYSPAVAISVSA
jgi:plastocyanin